MRGIRTTLATVGAAAILAGAAVPAAAQGFGFGAGGEWYLKGFGGATWPQDQSGDVNAGGTTIANGDASYDTGYTLGAAVGYSYTPNFALELEYAYRNADTTTDIDGPVNDSLGGSTNSNAVMLNAIYSFGGMGAGAVTPYVGGGLGWANLESDIDDIGSFNRDNAFAWQLIGGVSYDINPAWAILGEVRYYATDSGTLEGPDGLSWDAKMETVDLLIGATYSF